PDRMTFSNLAAGPYSVAETIPSGWVLDAIACRGGGTTGDLANAQVAINLAEGGQVFCTFINRAVAPPPSGLITIVKDAGDVAGSQADFTTTGGLIGG